MKKAARSITKRLCLLWYSSILCMLSTVYADSYSGASPREAQIVRVPVWVFLESQPGVMDNDVHGTVLPPRRALTELSKTVLEGMVYGWQFTYTPFDKQRQVAEEFELVPLHAITANDGTLSFTDVKVQYPYVYCWAEYRITDAMNKWRAEAIRLHTVTSKGRGSAERKLELEGIRIAYKQAALNAVRGYLRKNIKNKPKSVTGEMMIRDNPRLYTAGGKFHAEISVYLSIKEVIPYEVF